MEPGTNGLHRVLFVCLGNICRSPMAEGMFTHLVEQAGRSEEFRIDSAGTSNWHVGTPPDPDAQRAMAERGIDISGQRCRQVRPEDFSDFDLLIAMDDSNRSILLRVAESSGVSDAKSKVRLLLEYAPQTGRTEVPDPWSGGSGAFETAYRLIEAGCTGLLESLPRR